MIDTIAKAKAYGRLIDALHRITTAAIEMDAATIEDLARRVEVIADSIAPGEYRVGEEIEFNYDLAIGEDDRGDWRRDIISGTSEYGAGHWMLADSNFSVGPSEMRKVAR